MAHVMIVDDDRATAGLLSVLLEMDGHEVSQSSRPQGVVEQGKAQRVDAFVIDCHLGASSGLGLVREIRGDAELTSKVVVATSGRDMTDEATHAGADLFMLKPFSPNELSAKLTVLLAGARDG